jgi:hypothetical protein
LVMAAIENECEVNTKAAGVTVVGMKEILDT